RYALVAGLALPAVHPAFGAALLPVLRSASGTALAAGLGARAPTLTLGARLVATGARAARAGILAGAAIDITTGRALATAPLATARNAGARLPLEILTVGIDVEVPLEHIGDPVAFSGAEPGIATVAGLPAAVLLALLAASALLSAVAALVSVAT